MPVKKGFDCYACDRPGAAHKGGKAPEVYLQEGETAQKEWLDASYTDAHGVEQLVTLCPDCAREWAELRRKQAAELTRYVKGA